MKYLITESKLKELIKNSFGVDLTGKIHIVTSYWDLPHEFRAYMTREGINYYLNKFGPMFVIESPKKNKYLCQDMGNKFDGGWRIVNENDVVVTQSELMLELGIYDLGLKMNQLIDLYFEE